MVCSSGDGRADAAHGWPKPLTEPRPATGREQGTPPGEASGGVPIRGGARWERAGAGGRPASPDRTRAGAAGYLWGTQEGRSWVPYPPIVLDRAANLPLYRQIEVALRRSILDGRIGPGARLPGIRAYARHLGVGAVTVMTAYEQLTAEGYLEPQPGRGTLVAPGLPELRAGNR